ncbi:MAG: polysaccharide biosynthesis/export family protein, partial [Planctomycetota bacterium]
MFTHTRVSKNAKESASKWVMLAMTVISLSLSGCTALFSPIDSIPANRVPPQLLAEPQSSKVTLDPARLRQNKPDFYTLDADDVLGVFVEGVLGNSEDAPPVQLPAPDSDLPPAIGYPVPVREDGTLSLPLVKPIPVRGLTIQQAEQLIQRAYRSGPEPILNEEGRIIVTLMRERTYRVFVVRQDNSFAQAGQNLQGNLRNQGVTDRSDRSSRGFVLQLPAYKNDVLNALLQTGGIPGVNAKAEIRVLRGNRLSTQQRDQQMAEFYRTNRPENFPFGAIPQIADESNSLRIPLRLRPGQIPNFQEQDVILRDGDVVYVDTRETDVYYTGGLLQGGEFPIPRDYDLDVLAAISLAGNGIATTQSTGLFGGTVQ